MNYIKEDSKLKKLDNGPRTVLGYLEEGEVFLKQKCIKRKEAVFSPFLNIKLLVKY